MRLFGRLNRYLLLLRLFLCGGGYKRASYVKKKKLFGNIGEHCYLQPWNFGTEPYLIFLGDNVHIASNVTFVNHDIIHFMLNYMNKSDDFSEKYGKIIIGNNVFVGSNTTILYDTKIGNNVIIGAGSLVNRDIPDNSVAAGVPCKVIGTFESIVQRRKVSDG